MTTTYADLATLKSTLTILTTDTTRDSLLNAKLDSASRAVEIYCDNRRFYLDTNASARTFTTTRKVVCLPDGSERMPIDDIGAAVDSIIVEVGNGTTWTTITTYETYPDNAIAQSNPVEALVTMNHEFSQNRKVRVTARWGWPAVPTAVAEATLLQAARLFRRKDSPEGVAGSADWGLIRVPNLDPDVKAQLAYLHNEFMGA